VTDVDNHTLTTSAASYTKSAGRPRKPSSKAAINASAAQGKKSEKASKKKDRANEEGSIMAPPTRATSMLQDIEQWHKDNPKYVKPSATTADHPAPTASTMPPASAATPPPIAMAQTPSPDVMAISLPTASAALPPPNTTKTSPISERQKPTTDEAAKIREDKLGAELDAIKSRTRAAKSADLSMPPPLQPTAATATSGKGKRPEMNRKVSSKPEEGKKPNFVCPKSTDSMDSTTSTLSSCAAPAAKKIGLQPPGTDGTMDMPEATAVPEATATPMATTAQNRDESGLKAKTDEAPDSPAETAVKMMFRQSQVKNLLIC
jgi:hypothetical protein